MTQRLSAHRHWLHSEMWWPKLFAGGPEIAWDDYEKDYSDLPAPILAEHAAVEAKKEAARQLEAAEKSERDKRQVCCIPCLAAPKCTRQEHV